MKKESIERCMKDMEHCNGIMHTVKSGDTLYSISLEHKVPLALLLRANPYVDVYNLQIGETICVPVKGNTQGGDASLWQYMCQMGGKKCGSCDKGQNAEGDDRGNQKRERNG